MNEYKYTLDSTSKKFLCPACGQKRFVRYVDADLNDYTDHNFGRCDREESCGYHLNPYDEKQNISQHRKPRKKPKPKPVSFIPAKYLKSSRKAYKNNNFVKFLLSRFDADTVKQLVAQYHIGTSKLWAGATIFWQIDTSGKIRTGKIMLYDSETGSRVKNPPRFNWVHSVLKLDEFNLSQCLFGSHLIPKTDKQIAIVESEKTAIIASVYLPEFTWIATGGKHNLKRSRLRVLENRSAILFPDVGAFDEWTRKVKNYSHLHVSDFLENIAAEEEEGYDLADYLLQFTVKEFQKTDTSLIYKPHDPDDPQHNGHAEACDCPECIGTDPDLSFPYGANAEALRTLDEAQKTIEEVFGPVEEITNQHKGETR